MPFKSFKGIELVDKIINIDQSPIGRTPRSNPATYTAAFGPIRDWFTGLPESKSRGYKPGRFSFNVKGGRCEACEPTTGLHQHDIKKLLEILHTFVATGNTVVVIEHNLDVIKTADHIIDMGPDGGVKGGKIIAEGKPEDIVKIKESYTGQFLKDLLLNKTKKIA